VGKRKRHKGKVRRRGPSQTPDAHARSEAARDSPLARRGDDVKLVLGAARWLIQLGIWATGILVLLKFVADAPGYAIIASILAAAIVAYDLSTLSTGSDRNMHWYRRSGRSSWCMRFVCSQCSVS
jgi:hypothetical protein